MPSRLADELTQRPTIAFVVPFAGRRRWQEFDPFAAARQVYGLFNLGGVSQPECELSVAEHGRKNDDHKRRPYGVHGQVGDLPSLQYGKRAAVT
jgi:hypothetical protein